MTADDIPPTVPAAVRRAAERWPDEEAVVDGGQRITWAGLADQMSRVARALGASGVRPGDRVALWAPNSLTWIAASMGVYAAGAVLVPVSTRFKGREAAHLLRTWPTTRSRAGSSSSPRSRSTPAARC
jgi:acyl-CoA synthetase (AMP-forming)/AMP-acid ligase II